MKRKAAGIGPTIALTLAASTGVQAQETCIPGETLQLNEFYVGPDGLLTMPFRIDSDHLRLVADTQYAMKTGDISIEDAMNNGYITDEIASVIYHDMQALQRATDAALSPILKDSELGTNFELSASFESNKDYSREVTITQYYENSGKIIHTMTYKPGGEPIEDDLMIRATVNMFGNALDNLKNAQNCVGSPSITAQLKSQDGMLRPTPRP